MAYEIELTYPVQDEQLHDKESLLQVVRERLSIIDVLNLEECDYPREVRTLTSDIRILIRAALDKEDAEKVIQCGREGLEEAIRYVETIAVAVEVDDLHPLKMKKGAIFSLMYGLREMLERIEAQGSNREDNLDPLSPAALEKTIGLDGLRQLHEVFLNRRDQALDQIECFIELREGSPFESDGDEAQEIFDQRREEKPLDGTIRLGEWPPRAEEPNDTIIEIVDDNDVTPDEDAGMLLDSIIAAVPEGNDFHRLRIAAFDHHDDLTRLLTAFLGEHAGASPTQEAR